MREFYSIDLKDLQSVSVTCKQCGVKMTVPIEDLVKLRQLECGVCHHLTGETVLLGEVDNKNYLRNLATLLTALQAEGWQVEFEIAHTSDKADQRY